jgi:hypothetical protein
MANAKVNRNRNIEAEISNNRNKITVPNHQFRIHLIFSKLL